MSATAIKLPSGLPEGSVRYTHILDAIVAAIESGVYRPGAQLPTQRDLARQFGVAVGTVTRAYAEAARRGLVSGTAGRGTFVVASASPAKTSPGRPLPCIDFTINRPPIQPCEEEFAQALERIVRRNDLSELLAHQPSAGRLEHRVGGAELIRRTGLMSQPERVILCNGVQHGLAVVLGALSSPGDLVVTEGLNYPGIHLAAKMFHLRLQGLAMDEAGLVPDALDEACLRDRPRFLFCTPTVHNPASVTMHVARREAIAAIAARHDLTVIEDDIYGLVPETPLAPITSLVPERSYYLTGASKCFGAGIRLGFIVAPAGAVGELATVVQSTTWMPSPLMAAIVMDWLREGAIDRILVANRAEAKVRQNLAAARLSAFRYDAHPVGYHLWLHLPETWRQSEFVAQARKRALLVPSSEAFAIGRTEVPHAVRISIGGLADRALLDLGLTQLAMLIEEGPQLEPVIV